MKKGKKKYKRVKGTNIVIIDDESDDSINEKLKIDKRRKNRKVNSKNFINSSNSVQFLNNMKESDNKPKDNNVIDNSIDFSNDKKIENEKLDSNTENSNVNNISRLSKYELSTIKININTIIKNRSILEKLEDVIRNINKIVVHTYQFLELYLLNLYDNKKRFPEINETFIRLIMKTICNAITKKSGKPYEGNIKNSLKDKIMQFHYNHYKKLMYDSPYYNNLTYILRNEITDIIKNIKNNITEHFSAHFNRFVNCVFKTKDKIMKIKNSSISEEGKKLKIQALWKKINLIKYDVLSLKENLESDNKYHKWIKKQRKNFVKKKKYTKNNLLYDIKVKPLHYIEQMIYINKQLESNGIEKLFHTFPLRNNIIPKEITLETSALIDIFKKKGKSKLLKSVKKNQQLIWEEYFKINDGVFKGKNKRFGYQIKTNGVACSIIFVKLDKKENPINKIKTEHDDKYIENVQITDEIKKKKYIVIDPNYQDIIYCMSKEEINGITKQLNYKDGKTKNIKREEFFRYTQNQRRLETRKKKYDQIRRKIKKETLIDKRSIKEIENELSKYNSKTCNYNKFKSFVKKKNIVNSILFDHYSQYIYRKLQLNSYINTKKSEFKMLKNFKKKFGRPKDCIVIIGDFDKKENMKGKEPTINRKIRKLFRQYGYETYKINEFRTSLLCNDCEHKVENFYYSKGVQNIILIFFTVKVISQKIKVNKY